MYDAIYQSLDFFVTFVAMQAFGGHFVFCSMHDMQEDQNITLFPCCVASMVYGSVTVMEAYSSSTGTTTIGRQLYGYRYGRQLS